MRKLTGISAAGTGVFCFCLLVLLVVLCSSPLVLWASPLQSIPKPAPPPAPAASLAPAVGPAEGNVWTLLRLYEGFRGESSGSDKVVSSYYLKLLSDENVFSDIEVSKEKRTLKRVFNLTGIKLMTQALMPLRKEWGKTPFSVIVLNHRHLLIQLSAISIEKNRFRVEVLEDGKPPRSLLESKIILPEKKTATLGFEDSGGNIYFLSFHRKEGLPSPPLPLDPPPPKGKKGDLKKPRLIRKVDPDYPEEAKKAGIQGRVVVTAVTDVFGSVAEAKVVKGPKALHEAAVNAIKQWVYEPYLLDGVPKPVKFTVVVSFHLDKDKDKKQPPVISAKERPKLIKKVNPKYPKEALKTGIQGKVVLEATINKNGNVVDAIVIDGHSLLNEASLEAIKQWKYKPFVMNGVKKPVRFTVVMNFKLDKKKSVRSKK
ncbi:MAG: TonB family protein [Candidatus Aminicenantes bacterium]|nr:TonB family protein [Candidatus Aminicenantes bacterium]NIM82215.1 TonB family protein [Candidatus Aminicenantes bacterium]NIN21617.1 TonB family protein [Candidatus Aminicenantes bacterium]NIN45426.1 TonB family protein [Candidatus Aminicenantes bacterium]NIN88247.1 TonB family protein [Candidatus Aminicenantes bacterium]